MRHGTQDDRGRCAFPASHPIGCDLAWVLCPEIRWLQIPMSDTSLVRRIESVQNLSSVFNGFFEWKWSIERYAVDQLHAPARRSDPSPRPCLFPLPARFS